QGSQKSASGHLANWSEVETRLTRTVLRAVQRHPRIIAKSSQVNITSRRGGRHVLLREMRAKKAQQRSSLLFTATPPRFSTCVYTIVVLTSACPSNSCTVRMSDPLSSTTLLDP